MTTAAVTPVTRLACAITHKCQLECSHCYDDSGPQGSHGTMTTEEWEQLITEAAAMGVRMVQFIGGEPTIHPHLARLVCHAVDAGLRVEVFTNLVHVSPTQWAAFELPGVSLATSFYTMKKEVHEKITGRPGAHARTLENIRQARLRDIPVRGAFIDIDDRQDIDAARTELEAIGVIVDGAADRVRKVGRGAPAGWFAADARELCGRCGQGRAAVSPDGEVSPCVIGAWMTAGSVRRQPLAEIVYGARMRELTASIPAPRADGCQPECKPAQGDGSDCFPSENPACLPSYCKPEGGD